MLQDVPAGAVVAHYSGEAISAAEAESRHSEYILQIHSSLFLDAENISL